VKENRTPEKDDERTQSITPEKKKGKGGGKRKTWLLKGNRPGQRARRNKGKKTRVCGDLVVETNRGERGETKVKRKRPSKTEHQEPRGPKGGRKEGTNNTIKTDCPKGSPLERGKGAQQKNEDKREKMGNMDQQKSERH